MMDRLAALLSDAAANIWPGYRLFLVIVLIGLVVERLRPAERGQPWRHVVFNVLWTGFYAITLFLLVPPLMQLTQPLIEAWQWRVAIDYPQGWGWEVLRAVTFLAIYDFFYYWMHRAQHRWPALWAMHKLHHADRSLNVTTNNRHHWLEEPLRVFVVLLPMGLLFNIQPSAVYVVALGSIGWAYFIHANVRLHLGPLTPLIAGPQLHRIHHSELPQHRDKNFAAFFPIYDVIFGTYFHPARDEYPGTGVDDGEDMNSFVRASFSPFRDWWRMLRPARQARLRNGRSKP